MTETTRNGPSVTDCLEAAMRADPSLTIKEAIRTVPVSEPARQANLAIAEARQAEADAFDASLRSCRWCLFDIRPVPDGRWRLAWNDPDCDDDPFDCDGRTEGHEA